jgi:hypothetical protein
MRMARRFVAWAALLGAAPVSLAGQGLPPYAPVNPAAAARSGLATQPFLLPGRTWHISVLTDYASLIEYADLGTVAYLLDAEVLRAQLTVARRIGPSAFLLAEESFNGSYDGVFDGFLDWYHRVSGFRVAARELRPKNVFDYELNFPAGNSHHFAASGGFLGDLRLGAGLQHSKHWQSLVSLTLPTSAAPAGYRKGVVSLNATSTLRSEFGKRFIYEGTLGTGYTPKHGELSDLQHTTFLMVTQGLRGRVSGALHAYANVIYHSAYYHDTGTKELDARELTIDMGGILQFKRGPAWSFGLTEDLEPSGPAVDVGLRIGVRW